MAPRATAAVRRKPVVDRGRLKHDARRAQARYGSFTSILRNPESRAKNGARFRIPIVWRSVQDQVTKRPPALPGIQRPTPLSRGRAWRTKPFHSFTNTDLISVYSSIAYLPNSRPKPDCL